MVMFTDTELAGMRATYVAALSNACTITNPVQSGQPADVATDIPCAVLRPTRNTLDGSGFAPISKRVDWTITVPLGTAVKTGAQIDVDDGRRFRAGEIVRPASYSHCVYIEVTEAV